MKKSAGPVATLVTLVVLVLLGWLLLAWLFRGGDPPDPTERDDSITAGIMCEKFVERRVDRSDIEFAHWRDATVTGKGYGPYVVQSRFSVDGPWIDYTCEVEHTPDSDEWKLIDLNAER